MASTHLFADDLVPTAGTLRTAQRWVTAWRDLGFPRVEQVQRADADGAPIGGVQWGVVAADYDAMCRGEIPEAARAA